MKELDFDELDRAVNSLMTNVPAVDPPEEDSIRTVTIPSSANDVGSVVPASSPDESRSSINNPPLTIAAAPSSVAARRSGRFMDVVHPSSDMKRDESVRSSISRQGVTVAPRPSADTSSFPKPTVVEPNGTDVDQSKEASVPENEWPDPLELADVKNREETEPLAPEVLSDIDTSSPEVSEDIAPLSSPFLPDTKVEKRPLGGVALSESAISLVINTGQGKDDLTTSDPSAQLPASPLEVEANLPEELQGDLVAIESGAMSKSIPAMEETSREEPRLLLESEPKTPLLEATTESKLTPSGPVSIPQQYREEPSTGDQANGSIYDTDTYHQPLNHPTKKKSGWMWVVWIVLLLILGAGVGATLYFLRII